MNVLFHNSRIKLSQGLLFWRETGEGVPLIFLHGSWNDSSQWVPLMESLGLRFHCLSPDLLGCGESDNPQIHYSIDLQVKCIAEFLQALKVDKIYLLGHSLGGWIAASYALKYPEQVYGVVLIEPEGVSVLGQERDEGIMRKLVNSPSILFKILRFFLPLAKILGWKKMQQYLNLRDQLVKYPTSYQLLFHRREGEIKAELLNYQLKFMSVRTLVLQGVEDVRNTLLKSKTYTHLIPKAQLKIISHGADDLLESYEVVAKEIEQFVNRDI